ncbi:cytochrome c3 family protein [Anaeromyxobacter terrae]|uniref:cytochrome c3 family protein n=1 Tax=Anaeromyxobacter terrae TaxID=2925406 RepID=UPI001F5713E0|nr:cytochrome c3 family protein [Anaeromyxobacter sp. SG22]
MSARPFILVLAVAALAGPPVAARAAPKFKLKPGAAGQVCLECHPDFSERLKKQFVHTPVRSKECTGCHNPHASDHGKLLAADANAICATCHKDVIAKNAKSTHQPVVQQQCGQCHDPHASNVKFNLVKGGAELCGTCHKTLVDGATASKFKHRAVQNGCGSCHDAHASATGPKLLKADVPQLCLGCHKVDGPILMKKHMNYPVAKAQCTSCHDPHGSNTRGMLYNTVHAPVAKGMCAQCHEAPGSPNGFKPKQAGIALCRGCHIQNINNMMDKNRVHRPVTEGAACLTCHGPHASKAKGLLKADMRTVCGSCHADTIKRGDMSVTKHQPIKNAECTSCHDPHGSDAALMLVKTETIELCGKCHDWQKHASHPVGAKYVDPRNKNLTLQCLSCHRAHGTEFKQMMPYATVPETCTKCHEKFKR